MRTQSVAQESTAVFFGDSCTEWAALAVEDRDLVSLPALPAPEVSNGQADLSRDELILQHLPMVRFVARRVSELMPQQVELDDLISAGLVGLIDAEAKFDGTKQVQFKSYAQFRIRGAILDSLRVMDWSPRELRRKGRTIAEAIRTLSARLGHTPSDAEIAHEIGMELVTFQQLTGELKGLEVGSLNLARTEEVGDEELDFVPAPATESPLAQIIAGQTREQLAAAIETLPEKERLVLTLYYYEELTMREIGLTLGVVESRVSQIRTSAVSRLRTILARRPNQLAPCGAQRRVN